MRRILLVLLAVAFLNVGVVEICHAQYRQRVGEINAYTGESHYKYYYVYNSLDEMTDKLFQLNGAIRNGAASVAQMQESYDLQKARGDAIKAELDRRVKDFQESASILNPNVSQEAQDLEAKLDAYDKWSADMSKFAADIDGRRAAISRAREVYRDLYGKYQIAKRQDQQRRQEYARQQQIAAAERRAQYEQQRYLRQLRKAQEMQMFMWMNQNAWNAVNGGGGGGGAVDESLNLPY